MGVFNEHRRELPGSAAEVGALIDSLASKDDRLWPHELWPAMRFAGPLAVGGEGGHGPVRYRIEAYEPGARVVFRFTAPIGFHGTHRFEVDPSPDGRTLLRHVLTMKTGGSAMLSWPWVFRPLHDALLEDALDKAEANLSGRSWQPRRWSWYVRGLRRALARRIRRPGVQRSTGGT